MNFLEIFNEENKETMLSFLKLVLQICLQSDKKNEFISAIIDLQEEDQLNLRDFVTILLKVEDENDEEGLNDQNYNFYRKLSFK